MALLRKKGKLADVTRETQEEHLKYRQSQNTSFPRNIEEYITQVSEEKKKQGHWKNVLRIQQDRIPHFGYSV